MRFKKGDKVEVLTLKEVPSGSWRLAEIIGGNGYTYTIKYEGDFEILGEEIVEKVPKKSIRPCPPSVDVLQDWVFGDVLEVFHNFSWKMATVLKVLGLNYLLIRLLGSAIEVRVSKFDVRARLCWQDGEWILIGKALNKCEDMKFRIPSSRKDKNQTPKIDATMSRHLKRKLIGTRNTNNISESRAIPSRNLKRKKSHYNSKIEAYPEPKRKTRVRKHESKHSRKPQLPEKVDDIASSQEMVHENYIHPSFINKVGCSKSIFERQKTDFISLESDNENSISSSIASCSAYNNDSHKLHHNFASGLFGGVESQSDAESYCHLRPEEGNLDFLPRNKELTKEIHSLELHAYRCTIGALYALGPLSWEQELLLTNLRHSLHISNDEHLKEIRNLVSSSTCIPSS